jgi:hypothetical protein
MWSNIGRLLFSVYDEKSSNRGLLVQRNYAGGGYHVFSVLGADVGGDIRPSNPDRGG